MKISNMIFSFTSILSAIIGTLFFAQEDYTNGFLAFILTMLFFININIDEGKYKNEQHSKRS